MQAFMQNIATPPGSDYYLIFCVALLILPMIVLARWYHRNIRSSEGGRRLMRRQNASRPALNKSVFSAFTGLAEGSSMMRDISAGQYGDKARTMQNKVYLFILVWLILNAIAFGLLIWAQAGSQQ